MIGCAVGDCKSTSETTEDGITFLKFPNDPRQHKAWIKALGISEWELGEHSRVCSKHFLDEDFYVTRSGQRCIRNGAVPFVMKVSGDDDDTPAKYRVCRICLAIDTEMYNIRENALYEAYQLITGLKIKEDSLPQKLCCECAECLTASYQFRNKALLANHLMLQALQDKTYITVRDVKSINHTENKQDRVGDDTSHDIYISIKEEVKNEEDDNLEFKCAMKLKCLPDIKEDNPETKSVKVNKKEKTKSRKKFPSANNDVEDVKPYKNLTVAKVEDKDVDRNLDKYLEQFCDIIYSDEESKVQALDELHSLDASMSVTKLTEEEEIEKINQRKNSLVYKEADYKCDLCYRGFLEKKKFEKHMLRHSDVCGPYECKICKQRMKTKTARNLHMKKVHGNRYTCSKCGFQTAYKSKAKAHIKWHQGSKYECDICHVVYEHYATLRNHMRLKHVTAIICELCGYNFVNDKGLQQHKKRTHFRAYTEEELVGPYCETCDVKFLDEEAHYRHLRLSSRHNTDDSSAATQVDNKLPGPMKRRGTPELLSCELCGAQMYGAYRYARHFRFAHPGESRDKQRAYFTTHMCEHCGRTFNCLAVLTRHKEIHSETRNYPCDQCEKSFYTKNNLNLHKIIHMENRPSYECNECGQLFTLTSNLSRHKRTKHKGIKAFKCEICEKTCTTAAGLRAHIDHVHMKVPWPTRVRKQGHTASVKRNRTTNSMKD